jgi:hypothetical protein
VNFRSRGLVHRILRLWDVDGQPHSYNLLSIVYLLALGPLNIKGACGEQALWIKGFDDVTATKEPLTCLACLISS